ncbi:uncharacterized protein LOC109818712 [Cajanus cajan]|uniref:uncharacterized protein LOC109818712 n=1 Tax=Cajanus cajan TaxID=3821 RepID=UPI0010FB9578|nr:uncharacterized protein LOC109818712 [Cajanus cajan]
MDTQSSTAPQGSPAPQDSPAPTVPTSQATSKKKRKPTQMKSLARKRMKGPKISLDVDPTTGIVSGPNKAQFSSYLGTLARDKISILVPSWKEVPQTTKNMIWQDILGVYDISDTNILKSKMLSSVATKFRQHKSYLTREWVHGKYKGKSPSDEYNIDLEEWKKFKEIRNDPSWKLVRKKAQDIQKLNNAPHLLSRGGYELLVRNFMKSEIKRLKEEAIQSGASEDVVIDPPPPPSCHRLWNMARTKSSGEMTSESANQVAEKINELEEQTLQGSFIPEGRQDILTTALGRPEHPGRVRTAGAGATISNYFGPLSKGSSLSKLSPQDFEALTQQIYIRVTQSLMSKYPNMSAQQSHDVPPVEVDHAMVARASTKGSCPTPSSATIVCNPFGGEPHADISNQCELCIDEIPPRVVAIGRVYEGSLVIYHVPLTNDLVKVVVEQVRDSNAPVPVPTSEVQLVGQALQTFISWPRHLVRDISTTGIDGENIRVPPPDRSKPNSDPISDLREASKSLLYGQPFQVICPASLFGVNNHDFKLYISFQDIYELIQREMLNISIIQLWMLYLNQKIEELGHGDLYGFFEPQTIQKSGNKKAESQNYINERIKTSPKQIYLAPYVDQNHWQLLVLCPTNNVAIWFCSLHRKPNVQFKNLIKSVMVVYNVMSGRSTAQPKNLDWIYPMSNMQQGHYECGYYVMNWMLDIIEGEVTTDWIELFDDVAPLLETKLEDIRSQWAKFFLEKFRNRS